MTGRPIRLQLSRTAGFNLQMASLAKNGRVAVNVARPSEWGNPFKVGMVACGCRSAGECPHNAFHRETAAEAVAAFEGVLRSEKRLAALRLALGGKNLACWCKPGQPCHADVLLALANP